jgi:hypothetical protein
MGLRNEVTIVIAFFIVDLRGVDDRQSLWAKPVFKLKVLKVMMTSL